MQQEVKATDVMFVFRGKTYRLKREVWLSPIEEVGLSCRLTESLEYAGCNTIADLIFIDLEKVRDGVLAELERFFSHFSK